MVRWELHCTHTSAHSEKTARTYSGISMILTFPSTLCTFWIIQHYKIKGLSIGYVIRTFSGVTYKIHPLKSTEHMNFGTNSPNSQSRWSIWHSFWFWNINKARHRFQTWIFSCYSSRLLVEAVTHAVVDWRFSRIIRNSIMLQIM